MPLGAEGESKVVLYVAGVNGRLRESILKDTLSKSGTADITSSLFLRRSFLLLRKALDLPVK